MLRDTSWLPRAASCTLEEISRVVEDCSSTAAAMLEAMAFISPIVLAMCLTAATARSVASWM